MDSIFYCFVADILPRFLSKKCSYNQQGCNGRSNRFKNVNLENGVYAEYKDKFISMRFSRTAKIYPQFWKFRKASQVEKWNKTIQKNHSFKCSVVTISPNLISSYLCPLNVISAVQKTVRLSRYLYSHFPSNLHIFFIFHLVFLSLVFWFL